MKSRLFVALVVIAVIAATAFAGTTLARNGHGHGRGQRHSSTYHTLFTILTGRSVISSTGHKGAGDPDGLGSANVLIHDATTLCAGVSVSGLAAPTEVHIHRGKHNENGPPVVTLTVPSSGDPGASSGCVNGVATPLVTEISQHPNRFYIQLHTGEFPAGALRGQL